MVTPTAAIKPKATAATTSHLLRGAGSAKFTGRSPKPSLKSIPANRQVKIVTSRLRFHRYPFTGLRSDTAFDVETIGRPGRDAWDRKSSLARGIALRPGRRARQAPVFDKAHAHSQCGPGRFRSPGQAFREVQSHR